MICFVVPRDLEGINPGKKEVNMGQRCSDTRAITFDKVRIPAKYRLGAEGEGFKISMQAFDKSRPMVASMAVGVAQCAFDHALRYSQERKTFGKPILAHQAISFMLAEMATAIKASRLLTWNSAQKLDLGKRATQELRWLNYLLPRLPSGLRATRYKFMVAMATTANIPWKSCIVMPRFFRSMKALPKSRNSLYRDIWFNL